MEKISVIIPVRKTEDPAFLKRATKSVESQKGDFVFDISVSYAEGQANAVNEAVENSKYDIIAHLESDDVWHPRKTEIQFKYLEMYELITSNQLLFDDKDELNTIAYYPTPSGWMMRKSIWDELGGMNPNFKYHIDMEFLGKFNNASHLKRLHIMNGDIPHKANQQSDFININKHSDIIFLNDLKKPLVRRMINPNGGMETINTNKKEGDISLKEFALLEKIFGEKSF